MANVKNFKKNGTQVAVWDNEGQYGHYATLDVKRSYKDKEGDWKETRTLRPSNGQDFVDLWPDVKKEILRIDAKAFEKKKKDE